MSAYAGGPFSVEAFAERVRALIADDRLLIERLIRFAQAHDLLKKNAERAQKLAQDSNAALETYQKQVKTLEERNISLMTQQAESSEQMEQSLIDIAVESWRFSRLFGKVVSKLDAGESGRYVNQLRYFQKKVEESLDSSGLKLVNVEGQPYDAGMAASALNLGDFGPDDVLLVDQMVEPIIMGPNGLRRQGTVMLRKVEA